MSITRDRRTRAWIEVQAASLRRNLRTLREAAGGTVRVIPMVKADAYGLGMERAVRALEPADPWAYGVATVDEGRRLRRLGIERPVLVFSPLPPDSYDAALEADLVLCLSDLEAVAALAAAARRLGRPGSFHLEVDTGMGRAGFDWRRARAWIPPLLERLEGSVRLTGCFTHFHSADRSDPSSVRTQWERFRDVVEALPLPRDSLVLHAANSAAALRPGDWTADAVRPGIFLYGGAAGEGLPAPEPAASLRARVVLVREVPPKTSLGYGATHVSRRWERWATLGVGYGDGLPRLLSNRGAALLRGRRAPIVGRISMDVTVVDITDLPDVEVGEVATLLGRDGSESISLEEVAEHARTIGYEILTGFTSRLPRIWMDDGGG